MVECVFFDVGLAASIATWLSSYRNLAAFFLHFGSSWLEARLA